jgi:uncharacterized protein DUF1353
VESPLKKFARNKQLLIVVSELLVSTAIVVVASFFKNFFGQITVANNLRRMPMKLQLVLFLALTLIAPSPGLAQFEGKFEIGPPGCKEKRECTLKYDLRYRDPKGKDWLAAADNKTDGASIPVWAQPFIGDPFDESYIKAAVIHDHYCGRHVRPWRDTHRVFYDALIELGVTVAKAKLMYYAVYLGGPKWVEIIPGKSCGPKCIFKIETSGSSAMPDQTVQIIARAPTYEEPGFVTELKEVERLIAEHGDKADLSFLEKRAEKNNPDDFFYKNASRVVLGGGVAAQ